MMLSLDGVLLRLLFSDVPVSIQSLWVAALPEVRSKFLRNLLLSGRKSFCKNSRTGSCRNNISALKSETCFFRGRRAQTKARRAILSSSRDF